MKEKKTVHTVESENVISLIRERTLSKKQQENKKSMDVSVRKSETGQI